MSVEVPSVLGSVVVRHLRAADATEYIALERDPDVKRFMNGPTQKLDAVIRADIQAHVPSNGLLAIADVTTDTYIGRCGYFKKGNEAEIYCLLSKLYWRYGIGWQIIPFLTALASSEGLVPVGVVDPENNASRGLLERLGYEPSGFVVANGYQNGHLRYVLRSNG